jgi:hypothetical protein
MQRYVIALNKSDPSANPLGKERELLNQAISFFSAASRCTADIRLTPIVTNAPIVPGIVCYAFSAELYLKLIHLISSKKIPHGHRLDKLFQSLPLHIQEKLQKHCINGDLKIDLLAVAAAFVLWRYKHEHNHLVIDFEILVNLITACHLYVKDVRPEIIDFSDFEYDAPIT